MFRFFDDCRTKCCKCCGKREQYTAVELAEMEEEDRKERVAIEDLRVQEELINKEEDVLLEQSRRIQRQLEHVQLQRFMFVHDNLALLRTHAAAFGMSSPPASSASAASSSSAPKEKKDKSPKGSPRPGSTRR